MPYRTAPEKPVKVKIELTAQELVTAVRKYITEQKGVVIPEGYTEWAIQLNENTSPAFEIWFYNKFHADFHIPITQKEKVRNQ